MSDLLDFSPPGQLANDSLAGAKAYFYDAGTSTPRTVYSDSGETTPHPSPLVADADGLFAQTFVSGGAVKVVVTDAADGSLYTLDPCGKIAASGAAASAVSFSPTAAIPATNVQAAIESLQDDLLDDIAALSDPGIDRALIWDDSAGAIAFAPLGAQFIATIDASGDASVEFTGFDAALYDGYVVTLANVIPAADAQNLLLRTSTNGGSSYDSTSGDYQSARVVTTASAVAAAGSASATAITLCDDVGTAAGEPGISGVVYIIGPHLTEKTLISSQVVYMDSSAAINGTNAYGMRDSAADVDAIQFLFGSDNIQQGTFTLYGLRNA